MQITDVRIKFARQNAERESNIKATASINIDNCFVVHELKVIEKKEGGLLVAMPSRKGADGEYKDIAHPIESATREMIKLAVIEKYEAELKIMEEKLAEKPE